MVMLRWNIVFTKSALQDARKLESAGIADKVVELLEIMERDPLTCIPRYKTLTGNLAGCYSRRINLKHRLVYKVDLPTMTVTVVRMFGHY